MAGFAGRMVVEVSAPLAIDLYCGLGGWADGFLAEGYDVVGFDIERHDYGTGGYPGQLVLQDVLTLHGLQVREAAVIVASPPCQEYSYMAMPWSRAKKIAAEYRSGLRDVADLTALFDACFRIQREASEAAGRYIPLIVENVRGAQPWVGRSKWHYGSFHLWGDVPALMPITTTRRMKAGVDCSPRRFDERIASTPEEAHALHFRLPDHIKAGDRCKESGKWTTGWNVQNARDYKEGLKLPGNNGPRRWEDREVQRLADATKGIPHAPTGHWTNPAENGTKHGGDCFNDPLWPGKHGGVKQAGISGVRNNGKGDKWFQDGAAQHGSKSDSRKAASAQIAKIPPLLARHIARCFKPDEERGG